jgi:hypothetical protein
MCATSFLSNLGANDTIHDTCVHAPFPHYILNHHTHTHVACLPRIPCWILNVLFNYMQATCKSGRRPWQRQPCVLWICGCGHAQQRVRALAVWQRPGMHQVTLIYRASDADSQTWMWACSITCASFGVDKVKSFDINVSGWWHVLNSEHEGLWARYGSVTNWAADNVEQPGGRAVLLDWDAQEMLKGITAPF